MVTKGIRFPCGCGLIWSSTRSHLRILKSHLRTKADTLTPETESRINVHYRHNWSFSHLHQDYKKWLQTQSFLWTQNLLGKKKKKAGVFTVGLIKHLLYLDQWPPECARGYQFSFKTEQPVKQIECHFIVKWGTGGRGKGRVSAFQSLWKMKRFRGILWRLKTTLQLCSNWTMWVKQKLRHTTQTITSA